MGLPLSLALSLALGCPGGALSAPRTAAPPPPATKPSAAQASAQPTAWPEGTRVLRVENLEGLLLLEARLHGARDTSGLLVVDTGAGYLALDHALAVALGIADTLGGAEDVLLAPRPLPRVEFDGLQMDQVSPVLTVDASVVRRVTDRPVLGLVGERPLSAYIVWVDYGAGELALVPGGGPGAEAHDVAASRRALPRLSARAVAVPFRLAGDGKILVRARLSERARGSADRTWTLVLDTGATKTVLFDPQLAREVPASPRWPALRGLSAPTLLGSSRARIARVPVIELDGVAGTVRQRGGDAAVMDSELQEVLSRAVEEPVLGLLGYSFLRHYRLAIDYPRRLAWFDPVAHAPDERPFEYSHAGLQVERVDGELRIVAVADGSPAARAGIAPGDAITAMDGASVAGLDVIACMRRLEGPPGSRLELEVRRGDTTRTVRLVRRRLL